jgi:hypothetical protein
MPNVEIEEIIGALRWSANNDMQEAEQLRRYRNAKFGNAGKKAPADDPKIRVLKPCK